MTKRALEYGVLLAALWFVMVLYSYRFTAIVFYSFLLFPIILLLLFCFAAQGLWVRVEFCKRLVQRKESIPIQILLGRKYAFLPIGKVKIKLKYRNAQSRRWVKQTLQFSVDRGTQQYEIIFCSEHSGCMEVTIQSARVYDFFGMFSVGKMKRAERNQTVTVTVLPIIHELEHGIVRDNPYVMVESEKFLDTKSGDDSSQIFDIRDYREGDRINRIHWKLSAKEEKLMVKDFSCPVDCSVLILMEYGNCDSFGGFLELQDAVRDAALSLSWQMVLDGQAHLLAWYCARTDSIVRMQVNGEESFYEAVGILLADGARNQEDNLVFRYFAEYEKEQYTNIIYVTAREKVSEAALFASDSKKNAWLFTAFVNPASKEGFDSAVLPEEVTAAWIDPERRKEDLNALIYPKGGRKWDGEVS